MDNLARRDYFLGYPFIQLPLVWHGWDKPNR